MTLPSGALSAVAAAVAALDRIERDGRSGVFIEVLPHEEVIAAASEVDRRLAAGESLPLAGRTLAVKGNIDVAGHRTTAGCPSYGVVADESAVTVRALEAAGAIVIAITNLDQFATGLVGTRSPYGICPNSHWPGLVSGGSSSGSAVAVASGLVDLALGTDTAGSGRVPAAANGIVGLKPTRGRCSVSGVVPACRSLDCVSFFAANVADVALAASIAAAAADEPADVWRRWAPTEPSSSDGPIRLGVPKVEQLFFDGDETGAGRYSEAVAALVAALESHGPSITVVGVDIEPFLETAALLYGGAFVAERYAGVGQFVAAGSDDLDPIVHSVIAAAEHVSGWEVFRDIGELQRLHRESAPTWDVADVFVVPTVPRIPTVAEVAADPLGVNAMLGTYTNFVNLLDLTALTVPVGPASLGGPPASLTLIGPAWSDDLLVGLGSTVS